MLAQPLAGESRPFSGTAIDAPGAAANARTLANSLSRITLDDNQSAQNPAVLRHPNGQPFSLGNRFRGGDLVTNTVGVLGFDFSLYRIYPTAGADYMPANPRDGCPGTGGRHAPCRGDEHAQLLRHARHHRERHRPRAVRRQREPRLPRSRRRPAARVRPPARQAPRRADRAQRRHHRPQRAREHARTSSRSRASSTACPGTTTSTPGRSAPTRSRSASSTARRS